MLETHQIASGLVLQRSGSDVFAFWWSPDSRSIALLELARDAGNSAQGTRRTVGLQPVQNNTPPLVKWVVLNTEDGTIAPFAPFYINYELAYLGGYFDQFAVSHSLWSPDSRYLVYSEASARSTDSQVTLLDTVTAETYKLADGRYGVWSWE